MTNLINIELHGFKELEGGLRMLPQNLAKKHLEAALKKGLQIVKQSEIALAPKKTGKLAGSIGIYKARRLPPGATTAFSVKPIKKKGGGFAIMVEYGTKPHMIVPKKAGGSLKLYGGQFVKSVMHPGARPHPFLVPSWEPNIPQIVNVVQEELAKRIEAELMGTSIGSVGFSF